MGSAQGEHHHEQKSFYRRGSHRRHAPAGANGSKEAPAKPAGNCDSHHRRQVYHHQLQHYPVWRAGANEATALVTTGDFTLGDLAVPAGSYTLFVDISDPDNWSLIVSKATGEWGLAYDGTKDLGRTKMTMTKPPAMVENLVYTITDNGNGSGTLTLAWEDQSASLSIKAN